MLLFVVTSLKTESCHVAKIVFTGSDDKVGTMTTLCFQCSVVTFKMSSPSEWRANISQRFVIYVKVTALKQSFWNNYSQFPLIQYCTLRRSVIWTPLLTPFGLHFTYKMWLKGITKGSIFESMFMNSSRSAAYSLAWLFSTKITDYRRPMTSFGDEIWGVLCHLSVRSMITVTS